MKAYHKKEVHVLLKAASKSLMRKLGITKPTKKINKSLEELAKRMAHESQKVQKKRCKNVKRVQKSAN